MNCPNCDLPLADGPPQTCPRCYAVAEPEKPKPRRAKRRRGRRINESTPASEPGIEIDEQE